MKQVILNHYGFSRLPFGKEIAAEDIFKTQTLSQATAMLELGLDSEDIMLLTGPIGCGKSLIVRHIAESFDANRYQLIYLRGGLTGASELFKLILGEMKVTPPHSILKAKPLFFSTVNEATRKPVVVLDDAQDSSPQALAAIKAMTNFESDSSTRITFILVGQPVLDVDEDARSDVGSRDSQRFRDRRQVRPESARLAHRLVPSVRGTWPAPRYVAPEVDASFPIVDFCQFSLLPWKAYNVQLISANALTILG